MANKKRKCACELCGEEDRKLRRFTILLDRKRYESWRVCRHCCAVLCVLLADRRNHKRP